MQSDHDSNEEYLFDLWLDFVSDYIEEAVYHPEPYILFNAMCGLQKHVYTADWLITWKEKAKGILYTTLGEKVAVKKRGALAEPFIGPITVIDVKGGFVGKNNTSGITFPLNRKWMMYKFGIYVDKVVISYDKKGLFWKTFVPDNVLEVSRYVRTGLSKFKFVPRTFDEYLRSVRNT